MGKIAEPAVRFPRREAAARQTRLALVRAAAELFVERGYAGSTVAAIAERAGVARPTLFTSVPGGKPELMKLARDHAIAGDDDPVPIPQRPWFRKAMEATDPGELLRLQAANYRRISERAAALEESLVAAATIDAELQPLLDEARQQRAMGARFVIGRLRELGAVPKRSAAEAADTLYALAAPEVYLLLTRDRGWPGSRYERWLARQLTAALLHSDG